MHFLGRLLIATAAMIVTPVLAQQTKIVSGQKWPLASDRRGSDSAASPPVIDAPRANGVVLFTGVVDDAHIGPVRITNAYRAIETNRRSRAVKNVTIDGLVADNVQREGIRLRGNVENVTIRNFNLAHVEEPNVSPDLPEGIHIESGSNIVIENGTITGFQMTMDEKSYWNGDGITTEKAVDGIVIRNIRADNNTDAGFDLKSFHTQMDNVEASGNKRNFRIWNGLTAGTMTIGNTLKRGGAFSTAGLWIRGNSTVPIVTIDNLIVRMTTPATIIQIEDGPVDLRIAACDIQAPPGSVMLKAEKAEGMKIALGPSCKL